MESKHLLNRQRLKPFRSFPRNKSTSAEAVLWSKLKSKNLDGMKFRRQHSIGKYIVDFYCPAEKLIIEPDGEPHVDPVRINHPAGKGNCKRLKINSPGHPSLIRRENVNYFKSVAYSLIHKLSYSLS